MEQIPHFSHEHPLILKLKEDDISDEEISRCGGCSLNILPGSTFYTCDKNCEHPFPLHKTCAELPTELEHHHKHPHHTLFLHPRSDYYDICDSCYNMGPTRFIYSCHSCWFKLDVICASSDHPNEINTIQHRSHPQHPLFLLTTSASLLCHACGGKEEGRFYMCNACGFYIHQDCASFPSTIKRTPHHVHPLTLSYSLPIDLKDMPWMHDIDTCDICLKRSTVNRQCWRYYCRMCRLAIHIKCAFSSKDRSGDKSILYKDNEKKMNSVDEIRLPPANEYVSVVGHLMTSSSANSQADDMDMGGSRPPAAALIEVNRLIRHNHPLVLLESRESFLDFFPPESSNSLRHVAEYLCDVCFRAVSPPFYCCKICNLFLHEKCSKLPSKIDQHPFHRDHPLILLPNSPKPFKLFQCDLCFLQSNGICFRCPTCKLLST